MQCSEFASRSCYYAKDKQRFVLLVVARDSLPGHQNYAFVHQTTILCDFLRLMVAPNIVGMIGIYGND
ncbi:hypothetical protein DXU07_41275 [Bradyrhizobium elkanii]|nr:hypothetical protein [Bradyrhizobium elkanii]NWL73001.1 hypothetical protein [Bradyrhizobium elkanii]OIM94648.1 hypothetical protein BLN97_09730 [Bradyrhizobium elkanii]RYM31728.1 hypothetical protein EWH13_03430 [Bradyrhizobium elkanii]